MAEHGERSPASGPSASREEGHEEQQVQAGGEECRCKEAPGKSVPQLLRVMLDDLAFWKKGKKGQGS